MEMIYLSCLILLFSPGVSGQASFVCPDALVEASISSQAPCGGGSRLQSQTEQVDPGPFTIHWVDNSCLSGVSFRVTLRKWNHDEEYCVLQDRIPSKANQARGVSNGNKCRSFTQYYFTVNIPDVECENCYLQIMTISPNNSACLVSVDARSFDCPVYYTCSNLRIRSTSAATLDSCQADFARRQLKWKFKAPESRIEFSVNFKGYSDLFPSANGTFSYRQFRSFGGTVKYTVDLSAVTKLDIKELTTAWKVSNNKYVTYIPLRRTGAGIYKGFMGVLAGTHHGFLSGTFHIGVRYSAVGGKSVSVVYIPIVRSAELYPKISDEYNEEGWLNGTEFDSPRATLKSVIQPAGHCAPPSEPTNTSETTTTADTGTRVTTTLDVTLATTTEHSSTNPKEVTSTVTTTTLPDLTSAKTETTTELSSTTPEELTSTVTTSTLSDLMSAKTETTTEHSSTTPVELTSTVTSTTPTDLMSAKTETTTELSSTTPVELKSTGTSTNPVDVKPSEKIQARNQKKPESPRVQQTRFIYVKAGCSALQRSSTPFVISSIALLILSLL